MSKLKGPLFSLGARKQIGKALVFFPWKGLDVVREYVIPANPKTTAQLAQRAFMTAGVAAWHAALYTALDQTAWNRYAGTLAKIMSGFNSMVKKHIEEAILGNAWEQIRDVTTENVIATQFYVHCVKDSGGNAPAVHYGVSKTFMPNSVSMADLTGDAWSALITGLTTDTLYYFYIDIGSSGTDYGRTGIYQQRTS